MVPIMQYLRVASAMLVLSFFFFFFFSCTFFQVTLALRDLLEARGSPGLLVCLVHPDSSVPRDQLGIQEQLVRNSTFLILDDVFYITTACGQYTSSWPDAAFVCSDPQPAYLHTI